MAQITPVYLQDLENGATVEPWASIESEQRGKDWSTCINQLLSSNGDGTGETDHASVAPKVITGVDGSAVITSASHGLTDGEYVLIENVGGATEVNIIGTVQNADTNTFTIQTPAGVDISSASAYTSGGTVSLCYVYKPASDEVGVIARMNGYAHSATYNSEQYLNVDLSSGTGIELKQYRNTTDLGSITAAPVKIWLQWAPNAGVDTTSADGGAGNKTQTVLRWSFFKGCGNIRVDGSLNELLAIVIRDDITGLLGEEMAVQGSIKDPD
jgi:hypothetical protein